MMVKPTVNELLEKAENRARNKRSSLQRTRRC